MTWFDKWFLFADFLAIMLVQVIWQCELIKRDMRIRHGWHAFHYAIATAIMVYFFWPHWWQVIAIALLERLAFFDMILNFFRGKPLLYNGAGGSIQDRLENKLSSFWRLVLKVAYIIIFIFVFIKIS